MRELFSKVDIGPGDLGPAVVALYRDAANHSFKTLWQRALLVSGVPREAGASKPGTVIAELLTRQEGGQLAANAAAPDTGAKLMAAMRDTARQHLTETRALNADLRRRRLADAATKRQQQPGFWSQAYALVSRDHALRLTKHTAQLSLACDEKERERQTERTALLTRHRQELQTIRQQRMAAQTLPMAPAPKDMMTRQELVNTRVLTAITAQKMRPFSGQTVGALYFAALTQGLNPQDKLLGGFDPAKAFAPGSEAAKVRADARVLSFGVTVEQAIHETLLLQDAAQRAPDYARGKAQQVQAVLQNGFASEAGKIFKPNMDHIRVAIGDKIDALAALPQPPSGQVIPFVPPQALSA